MWCFGDGQNSVSSDPVVDIEKLLVDYAWKELAEPTCCDRLMKDRRYRLEVNWGYLDISHHVTSCEPYSGCSMFPRQQPGDDGKIKKRNLCLFRTEFKNDSDEAQNFTFRTERTTTSRCEVSLLQGFRIGTNVDVKITIPPINACRITGGLSGELQVTKSTGQTFEEQLTWSVDSQVKVEGRSRAIAAMLVREEELTMDMTVDSVISARRDHIPVYIRHRKTGELVKRLGIPAKKLADILSTDEGFHKVDSAGASSVRRETKGVVRLVYGAEQVIDLKSMPLQSSGQGQNRDNGLQTAAIVTASDQLAVTKLAQSC